LTRLRHLPRSPQTLLSAFRELLAAPEQSGVPVAQQRLIFRGHVLADVNAAGEPNTLQAVGVVEDGDTLHLVIRADVPPPAAPAPQARVNVNRVVSAHADLRVAVSSRQPDARGRRAAGYGHHWRSHDGDGRGHGERHASGACALRLVTHLLEALGAARLCCVICSRSASPRCRRCCRSTSQLS
jgi:hypothetical protein